MKTVTTTGPCWKHSVPVLDDDTREWNRALEAADARCPFELDPEALYAWLKARGLTVTAHELREAGEACGYFKGVV